MARRIVVFGAGPGGSRTAANLEPGDEVVAVCDSNPELWGRPMAGVGVEGPERLLRGDWDKVVIGSGQVMPIYQGLREMGIAGDRILVVKREILVGDYSRTSFVWWVAAMVSGLLTGGAVIAAIMVWS